MRSLLPQDTTPNFPTLPWQERILNQFPRTFDPFMTFESVMIKTTKTPWWWLMWCVETCRRIDNMWRIHLVRVKLVLPNNLPYILFIELPYIQCSFRTAVKVKGKSKGHPRTGHEGPEGEKRYSSTLPSTSALDGRWVVNSRTRPLYPLERPGTYCIGGWVGPRAGLDGCEKHCLHRDSIPGPSSL